MSFTEPTILVLLAVPVLLLLWAWQRKGWGLSLPFDGRLHRSRRWLGWVLSCFDSMPAIVLIGVICMLAGPQVLRRPSDQRVLTNIQFCLDVSGSMTAGNRYEMASEAVENFVDAREGDAFGLTLFGSYAIRWVPLTRDLDAIRNALPFADPRRQPMHMGGTRIGHALQFCLGNIATEAVAGDRMIILVSDGISSDLSNPSDSLTMADDLTASNITLFHVHVGTGSVPGTVQELARETGGEAFVATDRKGLERVFRHIDQLQPDRFEPGGTVPMDYYLPFAVIALSALGLHVVGLFGGRYTPW
ncbi:MAG: VWA domain-containing protein [Phycisphaerales bacterium]|jgi:Ca-activated chloride channel family protein|nr:VWA domain-containing protein [Phycisphaerales bacterium]